MENGNNTVHICNDLCCHFVVINARLLGCIYYITNTISLGSGRYNCLLASISSPGLCKSSRGNTFRQQSLTIIHRLLICSKLDNYLSSNPEHVVEIKMAPRGRGLPVDRHFLDICSCSSWDGFLDGFQVVVEGGDGCADVEERIVNCVLWGERGKDEELSG